MYHTESPQKHTQTHRKSCCATHDGLMPIELVPSCFASEACVSIDLSSSRASRWSIFSQSQRKQSVWTDLWNIKPEWLLIVFDVKKSHLRQWKPLGINYQFSACTERGMTALITSYNNTSFNLVFFNNYPTLSKGFMEQTENVMLSPIKTEKWKAKGSPCEDTYWLNVAAGCLGW